jgi:hypothetical protein
MKTKEPRSKCLSVSRSNKDADDIIDFYSLKWDIPYSQTIFRMAREYNQMVRWQTYRRELSNQ